MRQQTYLIIGLGLAALAGIFWLALSGKKEKTPTANKPNPSEATADVQQMGKTASAELTARPAADETAAAEVQAMWKDFIAPANAAKLGSGQRSNPSKFSKRQPLALFPSSPPLPEKRPLCIWRCESVLGLACRLEFV